MRNSVLGRLVNAVPMVFFALLAIQPERGVAEDEVVGKEARCRADVPLPNPWAKGLPQGWWMKRHQEILAHPARKEARIVFIGDSITAGWAVEGGGLNAWEKDLLPLKAFSLGIVCDSTQHALWRILNGKVDGMPNLKLCVVEIGVNNRGIDGHGDEETERGILAICDAIKRKAPQARILLMGVFPRYFGWDMSAEVNANLARLDDGKRIFFLNINEKLAETEGAIADAVGHLSGMGYQIWAEEIRDTVKNLMADDSTAWAAARVPPVREPSSVIGNGYWRGSRNAAPRSATTPAIGRSPLPYRKWFGHVVWGRKFERRKCELAFLGSSKTSAFPKPLWEKEFAPSKAFNLGTSNDCTDQLLWRIDNGALEKAWTKLKVVVVEAGTENRTTYHDKPADIAAGFQAICERLKANVPQAKILLMGLFPSSSAEDTNEEVNALISKLADGKQVSFLDINAALLRTPDAIDKDGRSLTPKGYEVWAAEIRPLLNELVK